MDFRRHLRHILGIAVVLSMYFPGSFAFAALDVPETTYNFGEIKPDQVAEHSFRIVNQGDKDRVIERVKTSCGCTAALVSEKTIKPGKEGIIKVVYDAKKGQFGNFHKTASVFIKGEKDPIIFSIKGEVKRKFDPTTSPAISITPQKVDLGEIKFGEERRFTIIIENKGKGPLLIKNFKAGHEKHGAPLNEKAIQSGKKIQATLAYVANKKGPINYSFTIASNDPVSPVLFVPVLGKVMP